jgi:hypothetical protein
VDVRERFGEPLASLDRDGHLAELSSERVVLTREALLQVDVLLQRFFRPEHRDIRYT